MSVPSNFEKPKRTVRLLGRIRYIYHRRALVTKYKDLSLVAGLDRKKKIRPEDHCLASRGFVTTQFVITPQFVINE